MSEPSTELELAMEQLKRLYVATKAIKDDVLPQNPKLFSVMAEGSLRSIRELQREIEELSGVSLATEHEAELWLSVVGRGIQWPDTPSSVLTAFIDSLRKGVQSVAEGAKPQNITNLRSACDFHVVALKAGSMRFGMRMPIIDVPGDASGEIAERSLHELVGAAAWTASRRDYTSLERDLPDKRHRRNVLNALKMLVPRQHGGVDYIELTGRVVPKGKPVRLASKSQDRIDAAIDRTAEEQTVKFSGELREIDLDKRSFILRHPDQLQMKCNFDDQLLESATHALGRKVVVTGTRIHKGGQREHSPLKVVTIQILEEEQGTP